MLLHRLSSSRVYIQYIEFTIFMNHICRKFYSYRLTLFHIAFLEHFWFRFSVDWISIDFLAVSSGIKRGGIESYRRSETYATLIFMVESHTPIQPFVIIVEHEWNCFSSVEIKLESYFPTRRARDSSCEICIFAMAIRVSAFTTASRRRKTRKNSNRQSTTTRSEKFSGRFFFPAREFSHVDIFHSDHSPWGGRSAFNLPEVFNPFNNGVGLGIVCTSSYSSLNTCYNFGLDWYNILVYIF